MATGLLVVIAACTGEEATTTTVAAAASSSTSSAPLVTDVSELPGRLVVLDESGNIVTVDPDGSNPASVTDDAGPAAAYRQPTFSTMGDRLAWAELSPAEFGIGISDGEGGDRTLVVMGSPPFFTYWSPDGTGIGVLHNSPQGTSIELEVVDVEAGSARVLATGSPFYFSWSPDSSRLAVHVELEVFATLDLEGNTENLGATARGYQAPQWTPDGILHLAEEGLELHEVGGQGRLVATAPGPVAFVANRQGTRLAIQSFVADDQPPGIDAALAPTPELPANRVVVLDLADGGMSEVVSAPSIGMFWSPDGEKLLVLQPGEEGIGELITVVWREGETTELSRIAPNPAFVQEVLQFFDQYGQSLQLWSPDSSAFALVGAIDGEPGIWVHTIAGGEPVEVHDGTWVSWSNS